MRYIVRIKGGLFSHASTESVRDDSITMRDTWQLTGQKDFYDGGSSIIEAQDINVNSAGLTKSKHYQGSNYGRYVFSTVIRSSLGVTNTLQDH